jgi:cytochrome c6
MIASRPCYRIGARTGATRARSIVVSARARSSSSSALQCRSTRGADNPETSAPSIATESARPANAIARAAVAATAAAVLVVALAPAAPAHADQAAAAGNFALKCAGCHAGGGNVLQAGATLATADLQRNGYGDPEALYDLIYKGKGRMPGFGRECAPKGQCTFGARLEDDEVQGLVDYVLRRAGEGWVAEVAEGAAAP